MPYEIFLRAPSHSSLVPERILERLFHICFPARIFYIDGMSGKCIMDTISFSRLADLEHVYFVPFLAENGHKDIK